MSTNSLLLDYGRATIETREVLEGAHEKPPPRGLHRSPLVIEIYRLDRACGALISKPTPTLLLKICGAKINFSVGRTIFVETLETHLR